LNTSPTDDSKRLSKRDEERLLEAGRSVFSTAFPNPNREGCPGEEVIKAISARKVDLAQQRDFMVHMSRCSPCFNDYARFRKEAQTAKVRRAVAIAAAVVVVIGIVGLLWFLLNRPRQPVQFEAAAIDLGKWPVLRGPEETPRPPLELAKRPLDLTILLPVGDEPGQYEVEIFKEPGHPLWNGQGEAQLENHRATLHMRVDLSDWKRGQYILAFRGKGWDWTYGPLVVK
jgi:hypothetical protein